MFRWLMSTPFLYFAPAQAAGKTLAFSNMIRDAFNETLAFSAIHEHLVWSMLCTVPFRSLHLCHLPRHLLCPGVKAFTNLLGGQLAWYWKYWILVVLQIELRHGSSARSVHQHCPVLAAQTLPPQVSDMLGWRQNFTSARPFAPLLARSHPNARHNAKNRSPHEIKKAPCHRRITVKNLIKLYDTSLASRRVSPFCQI